MSQFLCEKVVWALVCVSFIVGLVVLTTQSISEFEKNSLIRDLDHEGIQVTDVPFPTVTICPKVFNDRFNFHAAVLDETEPLRRTDKPGLDPDVYERHKFFFDNLFNHIWISAHQFSFLTDQEMSDTMECAHHLKYDNSHRLKVVSEIMTGTVLPEMHLDSWHGVLTEQTLSDGRHLYNFDFGRVLDAHGILVTVTGTEQLPGAELTYTAGDASERQSCTAVKQMPRFADDSTTKQLVLECEHTMTARHFGLSVSQAHSSVIDTTGPILKTKR